MTDKTKSRLELRYHKLKDLDEEHQIAEKDMRIEKYFADFWFKAAVQTTLINETSISSGYAVVELLNATVSTERDLSKYYGKFFDEKSSSRLEKVRFLKVMNDTLEIYQHPNSVNPLLQLEFSDIKSITLFRSCFCYKLTLQASEDYDYETVLIFSSDDEELRKWRTVLVFPYEAQGYGDLEEVDSIDSMSERRLEFLNWSPALYDLKRLEDFINNSEFVINPEPDDKLMIFDRVSECMTTFTDDLLKNIKAGAKNG